jgi:hypothetical protein
MMKKEYFRIPFALIEFSLRRKFNLDLDIEYHHSGLHRVTI